MKELHIVSFNVPYPADYGGVIDVFYKIKALNKLGVKVHLHTFQYGRGEARELEQICASVNYYKRKIYKDPFFSKLPYIVATRSDEALLQNLLKDNHPIIFEGVHCCFFLNHAELEGRVKIVRMHNIEHIYYKNLAKIEKNFFKKYFFYKESERLRKFQKQLRVADSIAAISPDDKKILELKFGNVFFLPPFHGNSVLTQGNEKLDFALYHGNLGVGENNEAALYLIREVFNDIDYPLVIAGNNPTQELKEAVASNKNVHLSHHISTAEIKDLISNAQMNILPTFQGTGMKLKLINVLFQGRFCIVNRKMVHNTGLEDLCIIANDPMQMKKEILKLENVKFSEFNLSHRKNYLADKFDDSVNAKLLLDEINQICSVIV
jgi:hypothetical protein